LSDGALDLLVVDDEPTQRRMLAEYLASKGHDVREAGRPDEAMALLRSRPADLVLTDLRLPGADGVSFLRRARAEGCDAEFVVLTAFGSVENAVEAMRAGAFDYLTKPLRLDELDEKVARIAEKRALVHENRSLKARLRDDDPFAGLGEAMARVGELLARVAPSEATILIRGESGTGKELAADRIHALSRRREGPLLKINCAALPETLLEAELFGYEKGAFTGAEGARRGLFEAATGGTLLLDEIGDVSPGLQVRLLRVIQEREVRRLGAPRPLPVDVRLLAATHRDLEALVREGRFREDLLYRLRVIEVRLPPLRERPEDVPLLADRLLRRHAARNRVPFRCLSRAALAQLVRHPFPGNVRELENLLERALILARESEIEPGDLPAEVQRDAARPEPRSLREAIEAVERSWIERAMRDAEGVRARAARLLGIPDRVLRYKMRKHGLAPEADKNGGAGPKGG